MALDDYNMTPGLNTAVNGVSVSEGMNPGDVNGAIREIMGDLATFVQEGGETAYSLRALVVPDGETGPLVPSIANRRNKVLLFDNVGGAGVSAFSTVYNGVDTLMADHRTVMAAFTGMTDGQTAALGEQGREGLFVFDNSNLSAAVTADPSQGIYVAPATDTTGASGAWRRVYTDLLDIRYFGALGGGVNDTAAIQAAIATATYANKWLFIPAGTWEVSAITFSTGLKVETAGIASIIKQRGGTGAGTRIITVESDVAIPNGIGVEGQLNQAGDTTGEQNHGVFITASENIKNVTIGPVHGTNLRGDVVLIYQHPTDYAAGRRIVGVSVGRVTGTNIYRNGVSICGCRHVRVASVECTEVGLYDVDLEPDAGSGPTIDVEIGHIKGSYVGIVGTTAADYCDDIRFGHVDLNSSYSGASSPAYPVVRTANTQGADAILIRNTKSWSCRSLKAANYLGQAIQQIFNPGELATQRWNLGYVELASICLSETTYNSFMEGAPGVTTCSIERLVATTTLSTHKVVNTFKLVEIGEEIVTGPSSAWRNISNCERAQVRVLTQTNGVGAISSPNTQFLSGSFNGDTLFSFSGNSTALDMTITATTVATGAGTDIVKIIGGSIGGVKNTLKVYGASTVLTSIDAAGGLTSSLIIGSSLKGYVQDVNGDQVVGQRGAHIAHPGPSAGGTPTGVEFNALQQAFNLLLAHLETWGALEP